MKIINSNNTKSKSLNILIYGGSFSPPTIAHRFIIESVSSLNCFDQIWVMPCRDRVDKKPSSSEKDRLKMIEIMIAKCFNRSKVCSSCFEYSIPAPSCTYLTFSTLSKAFPKHKFTHLIGEDSLENIYNWRYSKNLINDLNWLVVPRRIKLRKSDIKIKPNNLEWLNIKVPIVSSTMVRREVAKNRFSDKVIPEVLSYINERGLFTC